MSHNILIIGNEFDLYHHLPTRYKDFMFFASEWDSFYKVYEDSNVKDGPDQITVQLMEDGSLTHEALAEFGRHPYLFKQDHIKFLKNNLPNNSWIKCFQQLGEDELQWVDFEKEIQKILEDTEEYSMESIPKNVGKTGTFELPDRLSRIPETFGRIAKLPYVNFEEVTVETYNTDKRELQKQKEYLISSMIEELDILIKCLSYYLTDFVGSIKCEYYSEQIKELGEVDLLNFNYTTTFHSVYGKSNIREHHPIHGTAVDGNIVLGVADDSFPETYDYIRFQKFFQRIQKRTGLFYKKWFVAQPDRYGGVIDKHIYIMGHSLGLPDFPVLNQFFGKSVQKVTIFYHSPEAYENLVINLVKAFDKDEIIKRIGDREIEFEELKPAVAKRPE